MSSEAVSSAGAPLAARELPSLFGRVHAALAARREAIDDLNVFPVPDGDTGTNMTLTVRAGLDALHAARPASPDQLSVAVIRGAVRGARGNSGVIISQVLRAVVEVVTGHPKVDARLYADALRHARDLAYEAVADPVEGTILTVIATAAQTAQEAVADGADLIETSAAVCAAAAEAVERTRDQLAALREADVVDAGARGFEILLSAVHGHLTGQAPEVRHDEPRVIPSGEAKTCHAPTGQPFEVQYLLDAPDDAAASLRDRLETLGDSIVVVAAGGLLNVHVHTSMIGPTIEAGLAYGRPSAIEVTHFGDQIAALDAARGAARRTSRAPDAVGVVAVVDGAGLQQLARGQGAVVVSGTAGALPSVAELLDAVSAVDAARVVVLPGHRNAVSTANKAAELADTEAGGSSVEVVVEATTPPAVLAALAVLDPGAPPDRVLADMRAAAAGVRSGEVVAAVRDAGTPIGPVRRGQALGVAAGEVVHVGDAPASGTALVDALRATVGALRTDGAELVTLLIGAEVEPADRDDAVTWLRSSTDAEVEVIDAGCHRTRFWIGVE